MDTTAPADRAATDAPSWLDRRLVGLLNDPRDLPFLHLMGGCLALCAAGVCLFFVPRPFFWWAAGAYLAVWGLGFLDRFILMLHCTSHRILFRREHAWMNSVIPWVIGPFFGETPDTYFVHHMGMHHPENNLEDDDSTTMPYLRSSFVHWLRYYSAFLLFGLPSLARYHWRKGNGQLFRRVLVGEGSFWLAVSALALVDWRATLVVFAGPVVFVRTLMMIGNWGQHAFVDARDPGNAFLNSITCINTRYNRRCFNDGYHIHHHVKPRCHWTELPVEFEENRERYGREDAIVFDGLDFFQVWLLLMVGAWGKLASHFVRLPGAPDRTDEEVIDLLKSRVQPIPART